MTNKTKLTGKIWVLGDSIDTDLIVPSRMLTEQDPQKMAKATLETVVPGFASQVQAGDVIVAGKNFGCGSSREEAVFVLKTLGIKVIIAQSFARIFYRNAVNLGVIPIILPEIKISHPNESTIGKQNDILEIEIETGNIFNPQTQKKWTFKPFPSALLKYIHAGGAIPYLLKNPLK